MVRIIGDLKLEDECKMTRPQTDRGIPNKAKCCVKAEDHAYIICEMP